MENDNLENEVIIEAKRTIGIMLKVSAICGLIMMYFIHPLFPAMPLVVNLIIYPSCFIVISSSLFFLIVSVGVKSLNERSAL